MFLLCLLDGEEDVGQSVTTEQQLSKELEEKVKMEESINNKKSKAKKKQVSYEGHM